MDINSRPLADILQFWLHLYLESERSLDDKEENRIFDQMKVLEDVLESHNFRIERVLDTHIRLAYYPPYLNTKEEPPIHPRD